MTAAAAYEDLLLEHKPRPIRSDADCRRARRALAALMRPRPSRAASELIDLLATLIEHYESQEHPTPHVPARTVLEHLMDSRGISRAELSRATRIPRSTLTNVLSGRRELSKANIRNLSRFFGVSPLCLWDSHAEAAHGAPRPAAPAGRSAARGARASASRHSR